MSPPQKNLIHSTLSAARAEPPTAEVIVMRAARAARIGARAGRLSRAPWAEGKTRRRLER